MVNKDKSSNVNFDEQEIVKLIVLLDFYFLSKSILMLFFPLTVLFILEVSYDASMLKRTKLCSHLFIEGFNKLPT